MIEVVFIFNSRHDDDVLKQAMTTIDNNAHKNNSTILSPLYLIL